MTLASRFRVIIQDIAVGVTRDIEEDDLILAISTTTGFGTLNNTWPLKSVYAGDIIAWDNLTHEVEVPDNASNLSVAIGVLNDEDGDEDSIQGFFDGIASIAEALPGPLGLVGIISSFFSSFLDCNGLVVVDNIIYTQDTLNNLDKDQLACETKNYTYPPPTLLGGLIPKCGFRNSSYTVTHCLERLDDKSIAASRGANWTPSLSLSLIGLAIVLLYTVF
ncbi:Nn.00g059660.m01.CDS01 [Neocucurbitaria sp. VM-36]